MSKFPTPLLMIVAICFSGCNSYSVWRLVEEGKANDIRSLRKDEIDLSAPGLVLPTPLVYAIQKGDKDVYLALLEAGADPNVIFWRNQQSCMNWAAQQKDPYWIEQALLHRGDPNLHADSPRKLGGFTPLIVASQNGNLSAVRLLLDSGADIELCVDGYHTPLGVAAMACNLEVAELLLEMGADYRRRIPHAYSFAYYMRNHSPDSFVSIPHRESAERIIKWLAERGINYQETREEGNCVVFVEH